MHTEPQREHKWLEQLVGEWDTETTYSTGPGEPETTQAGTESVRSLSVWVLCEGTMPTPDGKPVRSVLTIGYDPAKGKFVGTFVASMMTNLWLYEGSLDAAGRVLTLEADGPSCSEEGATAKYRDAIEVVSPDHRVMTSRCLGTDGEWHLFVTAHYRRKA